MSMTMKKLIILRLKNLLQILKDAEKTGVATASTVGVAKNDTENTVADEPSIHEGTEKQNLNIT